MNIPKEYSSKPLPETPDLSLLEDWISQVDFSTEYDKTNFLAFIAYGCMLPVFNQYSIPLFGFFGSGFGTFKTSLATIGTNIAFGSASFEDNFCGEVELRKTLFAYSKANLPYVAFDDIDRYFQSRLFDSGVLAASITKQELSSRNLGESEIKQQEWNKVVLVTGTKVNIGANLERRTIQIKLKSDFENPNESNIKYKYTIGQLKRLSKEHRQEIIFNILALINNYIQAGMPQQNLFRMDSFEDGINLIYGALSFAGYPVMPTLEVSAADQDGSYEVAKLLFKHKKEDFFKSADVEILFNTDLFLKQAIEQVNTPQHNLIIQSKGGESLNKVNFGRWLTTELLDKVKTITLDDGQYKVRLRNRIISKSNSYWFEVLSRPEQKPQYTINAALSFNNTEQKDKTQNENKN